MLTALLFILFLLPIVIFLVACYIVQRAVKRWIKSVKEWDDNFIPYDPNDPR